MAGERGAKNSFSFNVGNFNCLVIRDGMIPVPDVKPKQSSGRDFTKPGKTMNLMCLLVKIGEHSILIDTGLGVGGQPNAGKLLQNLQAEGIDCREIDTVILSHGHGDHIGGITNAECKPVFPNACYIMHKEEWELWTSDPELPKINVEESVKQMFRQSVQKNLIPIKDKLNLINGETGIVSGIEIIRTPGHTAGHVVSIISSGTEKLLCSGDLIHDPPQLEKPHVYDVFDFEPEQASRTRIQMLSRVVTPQMLIFACHFPFPGLGHIVPKDNAWLWQPIETDP